MNGKDPGGINRIILHDATLTVRLPWELKKAVKVIAAERGVKIEALVREAICQHLKKLGREVSGEKA